MRETPYLKKVFQGWNLYDYIFLAVSVILPVVFTVIFNSSVLECLCTVFALFAAIMVAKGKPYAKFISIIAILIYAYVAYTASLYGEIIIYLGMALPFAVVSLVVWLKNKRTDEKQGSVVVVAKVSKKEVIILLISQAIMGVGYYYLLWAFGTSYLVISTICVAANATMYYLFVRRSGYAFVASLAGDLSTAVLWAFPVFGGALNYLPVFVMPFMFLVNDVYGIINWAKLKKSQDKQQTQKA